MVAWIKMSLGMELGLGQGDFVLYRDHAPLPKRGRSPPQFSFHVYSGQAAGWLKLVLGMEVGLSPEDFVLDGDPDPPPQKVGGEPQNFRPMFIAAKRPSLPSPTKGTEPPSQFSAHLYCAQTAGCIKMPLGMEVGLSPGEFVLDGYLAPLPKRGRSPLPNFKD